MNGFLGTYYVNLDDKGRVNIPSKFKAVLEKENSSNLVICTMEQYLVVFPQYEWMANEEKLKDLSAFETKDRNRLRDFYSRADECEMKSGKVLIPSNLRKAAKLNKEVVLVGMSRTFEIWDLGLWDKSYPTGSG